VVITTNKNKPKPIKLYKILGVFLFYTIKVPHIPLRM